MTVYAGGDDILAILPGNKALSTALKIQETFDSIMGSSSSISAGISVFNYKVPIYVGLEASVECLKVAKNNEGKSSISFDVLFGVSVNRTTTRRVYKWLEFKELLQLVDFMGSRSPTATGAAISQLRTIVYRSIHSRTEAELLIKYNIGRNVLNKNLGEHFLKYLDKGILTDAFVIYNIIRNRRKNVNS